MSLANTMERGKYGRGNGGSPLAAPRRPRTSGFRDLSGQGKESMNKMDTDSEMQDSPGSDVPPGQANSRQKRKVPESPSDPGDDSLEDSGSGDHEDTGDRQSELARDTSMKEKPSFQGAGPSKIPRRARSVLAKRLDPLHLPRGNDLLAVQSISSPSSAASVPPGRGPRRGRMPQKVRNSSKAKRQDVAAALSVSEQEREVAEALFGLANMAALHSTSPPGSPARPASPGAMSEDARPATSTGVTAAAAVLLQAASPALSVEGDDDSQPIIALRSTGLPIATAAATAGLEDQKQLTQRPKGEGSALDGAPQANTNLPALEATAAIPPKRKRPRARAKVDPLPASKDGGALAVLGAAAANLAEESQPNSKTEPESLLAPGLDVLAASAIAKELGKAEKAAGPPIAAFKAEKRKVAAEKKAKAEAAEKGPQKRVDDGVEPKGGKDGSEGNVPILASKVKEPRKRKEKENKAADGEKREKKRSKADAEGPKRSSQAAKASKPDADTEFVREGSYSDKSDREPIRPASQKSVKAAKKEVTGASAKAERAALEKEATLPQMPHQVSQPTAIGAGNNVPPSTAPAPTVPIASGQATPGSWAALSQNPMFYNPAMAAAAAAAAASAAWSNQVGETNTAAAAAQAHLPYMLPPRRPWKRCASHVYIAHFIEYQQTMIQLSSASLFLQQRHQPGFSNPSFGGRPEAGNAAHGGNGPQGPSVEIPAPSVAVKTERDPTESIPQQGPRVEWPSAFHEAAPRKPPQQPNPPNVQSAPLPQHGPLQPGGSPAGPQRNQVPASDPPPAAPTSSAPPVPNQGGGFSPTGQGPAQANAQAAYAAQQLAMLQQNGYPFPFNPASLNLPPFPAFGGNNGNLAGISPLAQYMAYMTSLAPPPQPGLPPQLVHPHHSPTEHLPQSAGPSTAEKPTVLARPNLNQQPMQAPRPPQHSDPASAARDREREEAQKARPNLNNRPVRPPQPGEAPLLDERKQFAEGGRPPQMDGGAMMSFLEQQSREQHARQQQQQQKMGPPYRSLDLPPSFLQNPELLYQKQITPEMLAGWNKQARPEGAPQQQQQQAQQPQRQPPPGGNERPPSSAVGRGPLGLNPAAAGLVPRGHTTMMGTPGMLPPGPMPANFAEYLADAQRRSMEQGQRPAPQEGGRYKDQPGGEAGLYKDMFMQFNDREQQRNQTQQQRPPSANEQRGGRDAPSKPAQKGGGTASPSLDLEGPSQGSSVAPSSRPSPMPQGPPAFAQPQRTSAGNAQIALQKTVLPRAKPAQPGGPVNPQQFPLGPERLGPNSQQLSMPKGYPFATSSGAGPNFGTGGLGSSSGRPIASQSFGALNQQQQKAMPQGVNLSLGGGQSGASATNQLSRLVDLSAANQQRPVGPSGGNFMQRGGGLGPMPQGQAPPQKGGETFARQQAKNSKGSGPANFAKPSPQSGGALFNQQRMPSPAHPLPQNMVAPQQQQHMGGVAMPGGEDKNWQYRNHGNPAAEAKKKADDETKKRAEKERRQARQRTKEQQGEFELQYLAEQQQQHDAHKKQAAAAAQQASEQYAAFAQAKKFAPGGLLFGQQQQAKAQAAGGLARQQGGGKGQMQARGGPPPANMHPPGEMGAGLTLGRSVNPSTGGVSRNGTPGPARSHDVPPHMQVARPISRGASGSKVPANGGVPFQPKQAPGGPPVSRQSPPMPVQAVPERRSLESSGAQSRDAAALQGNQLMEQQQAKPDALRQGYKPTTESNGLRPTADIALLTRPPLVVSASSPSKAAAPMPALAQASIPRNFESQLGSLPLAARLPIRDASEQVVASMQAPIGGLQVPISLGRDAVHSPTKDTAVQKVPSPRTLQSIQESAILPIAEADKVVSGS